VIILGRIKAELTTENSPLHFRLALSGAVLIYLALLCLWKERFCCVKISILTATVICIPLLVSRVVIFFSNQGGKMKKTIILFLGVLATFTLAAQSAYAEEIGWYRICQKDIGCTTNWEKDWPDDLLLKKDQHFEFKGKVSGEEEGLLECKALPTGVLIGGKTPIKSIEVSIEEVKVDEPEKFIVRNEKNGNIEVGAYIYKAIPKELKIKPAENDRQMATLNILVKIKNISEKDVVVDIRTISPSNF